MAVAIFPMAGLAFDLGMLGLVALAGSLFGVIAGGVAGSAECKPELREAAEEVARGRVLVTCEVDRRAQVSRVRSELETGGALRALAA